MPSHHSSHHSSSHHSSSHHSSSHHSTSHHHSSPTHHLHTSSVGMPIGYRRRSFFVGPAGRFSPLRFVGCLIVPLLIVLVPMFFIMNATNSAVGSFSSAFSSFGSSISSSSSSSDGANLASDPTVIADLAVMDKALDKRFVQWEKQTDTVVHHISASEADLPADFNTKEVVYGHCASGDFYSLVLNITSPEDTTADTEGYEYLSSGTPSACAPKGWHMMTTDSVAPHWFWVTIDTHQATAVAKGT